LPAVESKQDRVAEPEAPGIVVDESLHERLVELAATVRLTVPAKPFRGAMVMVEDPPTPASTVTLVGLDEMVKSGEDVWTDT
jgi:hypothetical protein